MLGLPDCSARTALPGSPIDLYMDGSLPKRANRGPRRARPIGCRRFITGARLVASHDGVGIHGRSHSHSGTRNHSALVDNHHRKEPARIRLGLAALATQRRLSEFYGTSWGLRRSESTTFEIVSSTPNPR